MRANLQKVISLFAVPVVNNMGWQSASSFSRMLFALLSAALLTRYMGPENYGVYSFVMAVTGILSYFAYGGTHNTSIQILKEHKNKTLQVISSVLVWRYMCWFAGALCLVPMFFIMDHFKFKMVLLIFLSFLFNPADVLESILRTEYKNKYYILCRIFTEILALLAKIACVVFKLKLLYFFLIIAGQNIIYAICLVSTVKIIKRKSGRFSFNTPIFKQVYKASLPMIITTFIFSLYTRLDQLMLSSLYGDRELGLFAPSAQIVMAVASLVVIASQPMQVKFSDIGKNHEKYLLWLGEYFKIAAIASYGISIFICLSAWLFVPFLFGDEFTPTIIILMIQIWACVFFFQGTIKDMEVINNYKTTYNLISAFSGLATNIALNWLLIPKYGGVGAAIATILSLFVSAHLTCWFIKDLRTYGLLQLRALLLLSGKQKQKT